MYFTPLAPKKRIDFKDRNTGEPRYMFVQSCAWHINPETPEPFALMSSGHFADFIVDENSNYQEKKTYTCGADLIRKDQRGRPSLGFFDLAEVK